MPFTQNSSGIAYFTVSKEGTPVDLTGCTVFMNMKKADLDLEQIPCMLVDAAAGKCSAPIQNTILSVNGTYEFQLKIVHQDGSIERTKLNTFFVEESIPDPAVL